MDSRLLVVDEEEHFIKAIAKRLEQVGCEVTAVSDPELALSFVEEDRVDVIVLGDSQDGKNILEILREIKRMQPTVEVILLTAHPSVDYSIQAMKLGAYDCLEKPISIGDLFDKISEVRKRRNGVDKKV
jgi:DNA-binding NtrC family response regulator